MTQQNIVVKSHQSPISSIIISTLEILNVIEQNQGTHFKSNQEFTK